MLFLAEAFTRPAWLHGLARLGFTQSYTYFTWRTAKAELTEFALDARRARDECRPNLFVNTPDILHESLQHGGPAMFAIRAALAATMAPDLGRVLRVRAVRARGGRAGHRGVPATPRSTSCARGTSPAALTEGRSLEPYIARLNEIRRAHPALQQLRNMRFHPSRTTDQLVLLSKTDDQTGDTVLVVVTLDPNAQGAPPPWTCPRWGCDWGDRSRARRDDRRDTYEWGQFNYVAAGPARGAPPRTSSRCDP